MKYTFEFTPLMTSRIKLCNSLYTKYKDSTMVIDTPFENPQHGSVGLIAYIDHHLEKARQHVREINSDVFQMITNFKGFNPVSIECTPEDVKRLKSCIESYFEILSKLDEK